MPEGTSEQKPLHERYGFESEDKMAEAFEALKGDVGKFKAEARTAKELTEKLAALEAAEAKRKESEMSENEKLAAKVAAMEKQMQERDALLKRKDRDILTERVFSSKLSGKTPEEAAVLRRLLSSAVAGAEFADEAELAEVLKPVETEYEALRAKIGTGGGPGLAVSGSHGQTPQTSAAVKDFLGLPMRRQLEIINDRKKG